LGNLQLNVNQKQKVERLRKIAFNLSEQVVAILLKAFQKIERLFIAIISLVKGLLKVCFEDDFSLPWSSSFWAYHFQS
jgi:hypothetical protein